MLCVKFRQTRTINKEFEFWGFKGAVLGGLGVAKVGTTWKHVPKHHRRLFLPKKQHLYAMLFVRGFTLSPVDYSTNLYMHRFKIVLRRVLIFFFFSLKLWSLLWDSLTLLLYFFCIFYVSQCALPNFPSVYSLPSLPFLSCCHRTTTSFFH